MSTFSASSHGRRDRASILSLATVLALALLAATHARGALGPNDRRLTNSRVGISVEAPAGWTLSQHTGYSETVVLLLHPDGSRISVTTADTPARTSAQLYESNRPGLAAQGLTVSPVTIGARGFLVVDLSARDRPDKLRQFYLVRPVAQGRQAVVLTLISKSASFVARTAALDFVAARMTFEEPVLPSGAPRGTLPAAGAGGQPGR